MNAAESRHAYSELLSLLSESMATGRPESIADVVDSRGAEAGIQEHLANAFGERFDLLRRTLALVALSFENFDSLLFEYMRTTPSATYHAGVSDAERCLAWLCTTRELTPQQQDFITYREAEFAVERLARTRRGAHVRFQQMQTEMAPGDWAPGSTLHVNPILVQAKLSIGVQPTDGGPPRPMLFFAHGTRTEVGQIEAIPHRVLSELQSTAPVSVAECCERRGTATIEEWLAALHELAAHGLIAVEALAERQASQRIASKSGSAASSLHEFWNSRVTTSCAIRFR